MSDNTYWPPVEPTTPVPYPYSHEYEIGIPPPPPKQPRKFPMMVILMTVFSLLLFASAGLFYLAHTYTVDHSRPTPVVIVVTPTPVEQPTTVVATPQLTVDPNYTATDILGDMISEGCDWHCGGISYGTTIWTYTDNNYYVSVHATSSVTWSDPPQTAGAFYIGLWVYKNADLASLAYNQVGNDQGTGLAHYQWPSEFLHGRCLFLMRTGDGNSNGTMAPPWSGYQQVIDQYCV